MSAPRDNHAAGYRVTHQDQSTQMTPDGNVQKVWTVHLEHSNGVKGTVELPDEVYTPANVHALAAQQSEDVHRVGQLPGSLTDEERHQAEAG